MNWFSEEVLAFRFHVPQMCSAEDILTYFASGIPGYAQGW